MKVTTIGIDLAKDVFQIHGVDEKGKVVLKKRVKRYQLLNTIAKLPPCLVGMEACGGAHYFAREIQKLGHEVKLMHPRFVKPYVKSNKNDDADAEAICEAVGRPTMRFVPVNTVEQQDIQSIHRIRSLLKKQLTAVGNQTRGLLMEYGVTCAKGYSSLKAKMLEVMSEGAEEVSSMMLEMLVDLTEEIRILEERIKKYDARIEIICQRDERCQRLMKIEGVGPITATAVVAAIGDGKQFKDGRALSAFLGLVPRQNSSGGKEVLGGISKRGDGYLRSLLIHGSRSVMRHLEGKEDARSQWFRDKVERRGQNRAVVAYANKQARIIWAILTKGESYRVATAVC